MRSSIRKNQHIGLLQCSVSKKGRKAEHLATQLCLWHPVIQLDEVHRAHVSCRTFHNWVRELSVHSFIPCSNVIDCALPFQSWKFHATGVTNQGSKAAQPSHREFGDKQNAIDVGPAGGHMGVQKQKAPQDSQQDRNNSAGFSQTHSGHRGSAYWRAEAWKQLAFATPRLHPSHLCPPDPFFTCNVIPVSVHKCDGGLHLSHRTLLVNHVFIQEIKHWNTFQPRHSPNFTTKLCHSFV